MTAIKRCYTCHDPLPAKTNQRYCAEFHGKRYEVCEDCAGGITIGIAALSAHGVTGEAKNRDKRTA